MQIINFLTLSFRLLNILRMYNRILPDLLGVRFIVEIESRWEKGRGEDGIKVYNTKINKIDVKLTLQIWIRF